MFPACYGLAMTRHALIFGRMIVVERGLNILGAQIAERPAQPGFRRRTDGPYTWINFPKAFILSNPRVAATFTALPAAAQRNSDDYPTGKRTVRGAYCRHVRVGSQIL